MGTQIVPQSQHTIQYYESHHFYEVLIAEIRTAGFNTKWTNLLYLIARFIFPFFPQIRLIPFRTLL